MGEPRASRQVTDSAWRKASRCQSGECLEVRRGDGWVGVRDSTDASVEVSCSAEAWLAFTGAIKTGEYDDLI
jgi:Domain of unknown function (DUF397)